MRPSKPVDQYRGLTTMKHCSDRRPLQDQPSGAGQADASDPPLLLRHPSPLTWCATGDVAALGKRASVAPIQRVAVARTVSTAAPTSALLLAWPSLRLAPPLDLAAKVVYGSLPALAMPEGRRDRSGWCRESETAEEVVVNVVDIATAADVAAGGSSVVAEVEA